MTYVAAGRAIAQPAAMSTTSAYDALVAEYRPHLDVDDPLGFGMKVRAIAGDEYQFWRGTKGRYFAWCRDHAADWLADAADRVPAHGDLHYGNVGLYAAGPRLGDRAFGMVDFDDAQSLPFQTELLHLFVTARLVTPTGGDRVDVATLDRATLDAYRAALTSGRTATALLADDAIVAKLTKKAGKAEYADDLRKFCNADGSFRTIIGKAGALPSDLLESIAKGSPRLDAFASAVADACTSDASLRDLLGTDDRAAIRERLVGVARRTRVKSSGSQGLNKYLVRVARLGDGDVIVYLKQQIPTAAERAGYVPADAGAPGERAARMADGLAHPRPIVNGFAALEGGSYLVSLREPWSDELDAGDLKTADDLLHFCQLAATVAGAAHGAEGRGDAIAARVDDALAATLAARADEYVASMRDAFRSLRDDPRTTSLVARTDDAIASKLRSDR